MKTIELWKLILTSPLGLGKTYWAMKMAVDRKAVFIAATRQQAQEATNIHGIKAIAVGDIKNQIGFRGPYVVDPDAMARALDQIEREHQEDIQRLTQSPSQSAVKKIREALEGVDFPRDIRRDLSNEALSALQALPDAGVGEAELIKEAYGLSCYAAASKIENTPEFLDGLLDLCEGFQKRYKVISAQISVCPECGGNGCEPQTFKNPENYEMVPCPTCQGKGTVERKGV